MSELKYVPVFRGRQEEIKVLKSFDFGDHIYPCLEIIKEIDRKPPKARKNSKKKAVPKPPKKFEEVYFPLIDNIRAKRIFIDLPVHLQENRNMKPECLDFMRGVVAKRQIRTEYIKKFKKFGDRIIPVISSYFTRTGEQGSMALQETELRKDFANLSFRILLDNFDRDFNQVMKIIQPDDFLIIDFGEQDLNAADPDQKEMITHLKKMKCTVIIHKSPVLKDAMNKDIEHGELIEEFINNHKELYPLFAGNCFSDYGGIKKDNIPKGGAISPGFIYYDAVRNKFFGYRGEVNNLETFETLIIPSVIISDPTKRMQRANPTYLGQGNVGWAMINLIHDGLDTGKNAAKFKRISMEHYLSCIKLDIDQGKFDQS